MIILKIIFLVFAIITLKYLNSKLKLGLLSACVYLIVIIILFFFDALIQVDGDFFVVDYISVFVYGFLVFVFYFIWLLYEKRSMKSERTKR
ncbi:hypothetical protein H0S68_24540 (plasmid) [Serratia sp. AXJ-M]|uniref:hypothetical protein n=1 Tax=Serratia sp. AXJ-M TaxID=2754727 RepID=UPI0039793934